VGGTASRLGELAYLAQTGPESATCHAEFARRGLYFPLQNAIGTQPLGKRHAESA
jgi:hypothetical protein